MVSLLHTMRRGVSVVLVASALAAVAATPADNRPDGADHHLPPGEATVPAPARGVVTEVVSYNGQQYFAVVVDLALVPFDLIGQAPGPSAVRTFAGLEGWLEREQRSLVMATNAGLFHADHRPVGLHIEGGVQRSPAHRGTGEGNFWLLPNGVFAVDGRRAGIWKTADWPPASFEGHTPRLAVQSGPLLVHGGALHPAFDPASKHQRVRSGIGVRGDGAVVFVLSAGPVRFHALATVFRDHLGCPDALYLDGGISGLRAPGVPLVHSTRAHSYAGFFVVSRPRDPAGSPPTPHHSDR